MQHTEKNVVNFANRLKSASAKSFNQAKRQWNEEQSSEVRALFSWTMTYMNELVPYIHA